MTYIKSEVGQQAFKDRSPAFSARQRSMFILFDGHKSVSDVLKATTGLGVTQADVDHMVAQGFLVLAAGATVAAETAADPVTGGLAPAPSGRSEQERYQDAKPLATQLTAGLGLRGFRLNMSVESASGFRELLALLPKIQEAVGAKDCRELERALKG